MLYIVTICNYLVTILFKKEYILKQKHRTKYNLTESASGLMCNPGRLEGTH